MAEVARGIREAARRRVAMVLIPGCTLSALLAALLVPDGPLAAAGDLENERDRVEDQLDDKREDLNQSTVALDEATEAYERAEEQLQSAEKAFAAAEAELAAAQDELDRAESDVAVAKAKEAQAAERLAAAEQRVRDQVAKIEALNVVIDGQNADMSQLASATYRRGGLGRLPEVAAVLAAPTLSEASRRLGYARSIIAADGIELTEMQATRTELANERVRLDELRDETERLRNEAAEHLEQTKELEAAARQVAADAADWESEARAAKEKVDALIGEREQAMAAAEDARDADAAAYAELQAERKRIDAEIKELARERRETEERASLNQSSRSNNQSASGNSCGSASPLACPVTNPYVTSSYGMRVHPVTGVYKLHDGTDFRAYCGTPIRAARDGKVEWAYNRGGYGNQLLVDHGWVNGTHLMSSYSHLSRFAASSGERVSQGEVIGYSGTTGYSTACHLHFMVYADGSRVDPMSHL